jgi:uncharacterized protein YbjT (DUF2867 family)
MSVADDSYTRSKKQQEQIVANSGIACPIFRPTLMYGWFDRKHLGWLARFMNKSPIFPIPGDGKFMRQPFYMRVIFLILAQSVTPKLMESLIFLDMKN